MLLIYVFTFSVINFELIKLLEVGTNSGMQLLSLCIRKCIDGGTSAEEHTSFFKLQIENKVRQNEIDRNLQFLQSARID